MRFDSASWILGCARRALAALAILAVFSLATPSASASITLFYSATDNGNSITATNSPVGSAGSFLSVGGTVGDFNFSVTENATNNPGASTLATTTFSLNNTGAATNSITILTSGTGFTAGIATEIMSVGYSISGSSANFSATDPVTANSWAAKNNAAFGTTTPVGVLTGSIPTSSLTGSYVFTSGGNSPTVTFARGGAFSLSQSITVTLAVGDQANFTITTKAVPSGLFSVPEPSSMALAGLGTLGLIGYGLRRRKALGV